VALNVDEAAVAMTAGGDDLADLCASAARVRDAGLESAGRRGPNGRLPVSYSRKVFIPVTHLCRDTCHYCAFVTVPGRLRAQGMGMYMEPDEILDVARRGAELGCKEALFTLGDRPETRWDEARQWLDERGYDSTLDYVRAMAIRVLEGTGLLPHLNPGVMSWSELSRLKPVAPSMGMMLETTSRRLFETKGLAHYGSPDKESEVRLRTLADAGRLSIPFTTGLLVGIGETLTERAETMHAIRRSHKEFGHVQEVIVQNFRAKEHTAMAAVPDAGFEDFLATVAVARLVLGPNVRVQAPPNLVSRAECLALIGAGVDDWGGVSPLTPDHVNPERPWPALDELAAVTAEAGYDLVQAAEILDDVVRWVLTKGKLPTSMWIEVVTTAHEVGLRSSSTMMYGHVDAPRHWVGHLRVLRDIQDQTGGFTEFLPLPFVHQNSPLYLAGGARPGPTHRDNRAVHALARIMLHGRISNIQTSWVKLGTERTQVMLCGGANDLGGTLMEETISRMAGSEFGSAKTVEELVAVAAGIGRPARQRTTTYTPITL